MNFLKIALLLSCLSLVSCGGGGGGGSGASRSTSPVSAEGLEAELVKKLSTQEMWTPQDLLLEAHLVSGDKAMATLQRMDRFFIINCSKVRCALWKKDAQ